MRIPAVIVLVVASIISPLLAQQRGSGGISEKIGQIFQRLDPDGDGKLSREDLLAGTSASMAGQLGSDHDNSMRCKGMRDGIGGIA